MKWHEWASSYLALSGVVAYAFVYEVLSYFYHSLGVSPSEAGISYASALTAAAGLLILIAVVGIVFVGPATNALAKLRVDNDNGGFFGMLFRCFIAAVLMAVIVILVVTPFGVRSRVARVREGKAASPISFKHIPLLDVRATPVQVQWINPAAHPNYTFPQRVLFLGQNNGVFVLYTPDDHRALRVSAAQAFVQTVP